MGRPLTVNVIVLDEASNPVVLEAGSDVPSWASEQVGDHCFEKQDEPDDAKPAARKGRQRSTGSE